MPSRVSAKSARSSAATTKARQSNNEADVPDEGPFNALRNQICGIFADAQRSNTGHRKLVVGLRKVQEACCYEPANPRNNSCEEEFDEVEFNEEVSRCSLRILPVKKSEPAGDRVLKFLGLFLKHAAEADNAIFAEEDPEAEGLPETPSSRLASQIISVSLRFLQAKDKVVRFRCTQIISHLINTLDSIDDDLFQQIRLGLLKRLRDKESSVRVQAVCGLGRLAGDGDPGQDDDESDDDLAGDVLEKLLNVLQNDPSAEVRRSLLLNLPFTPSTLPFLLERARDLDGSIRRALYARLLPALGDFRHLSLTHREKLLRWGFRDRDENVRKATGKLFSERWIEDCARPRNEDGGSIDLKPGQVSTPSSEGLNELLERIDVVNAGNDDGIALDAMKGFWSRRPDYCEFMKFDETYWKELTPESVFVARSFNDFCRHEGTSDALQEKLPEVTRVAYLVQHNINMLVELVQRIAVQEDEDSVHQEFIVEQLLQIALTLDYSDEVGRRIMFSLMREALALAELPEEATRLVIEVLRTCCGTHSGAERDFCGVVLEAIAEVHDTIMGDFEEQQLSEDGGESFHSAQSELSSDSTPKKQQDQPVDEEKLVREIMVNMKCLHIAQCMLQNVECTLENNAHLITMLNNLVVPAVRSQEAPIRERGLLCLGLCCLLDKNLADENLSLFLHCFHKGHEQLQGIAIQIVGDILAAHPSMLLSPKKSSADGGEAEEKQHALHKPIRKLFSKSFKSPVATIQSTACAALCKLMLSAPSPAKGESNSSILNLDELLHLLVMAYFDPETAGNASLRQSLSYFIPVFCHSRRENMQCMGRIALNILHWCVSIKDEMDVDDDEAQNNDMVGLGVITAHLVDWTDGRKLALAKSGLGDEEAAKQADCDVHLDLAEQILEKVLGVCSREDRKLYMSMLSKLSITGNSDRAKMQSVSELVEEALQDKLAADAPSRNALTKIQTVLSKGLTEASRSHSRAASRSRSVAPSNTGDGIDEDDEDDASGDVEAPAIATTPAVSSRKRTNRKMTARGSVAELEDATQDLTLASNLVTPATSPAKKSGRGRPASLRRMTAAKAYDEEDQENMPPRTPAEEQTPVASPRKDRGRPKQSMAAPSAETVIKEETMDVDMPLKTDDAGTSGESNQEPPVRNARGRPAKSSMVDKPLASTTRPARTNARGARRRATQGTEES